MVLKKIMLKHDLKLPKWVFPYERTMFSQEYKPSILGRSFNNYLLFSPYETTHPYSVTGCTLV